LPSSRRRSWSACSNRRLYNNVADGGEGIAREQHLRIGNLIGRILQHGGGVLRADVHRRDVDILADRIRPLLDIELELRLGSEHHVGEQGLPAVALAFLSLGVRNTSPLMIETSRLGKSVQPYFLPGVMPAAANSPGPVAHDLEASLGCISRATPKTTSGSTSGRSIDFDGRSRRIKIIRWHFFNWLPPSRSLVALTRRVQLSGPVSISIQPSRYRAPAPAGRPSATTRSI